MGISFQETVNGTQLRLAAFPPSSNFRLPSLVLAQTFEFSFGVVFVLIERELWMF